MSVTVTASIVRVDWVESLGDFSTEFTEMWFIDEQSANAWIDAWTGYDDYGDCLWDKSCSSPRLTVTDTCPVPVNDPDADGVIAGRSWIEPDPDRDQLIVESIMSDVRCGRLVYGPSPIDPIMSDVCGRPVPEYTCWLGE